ncbi:MAG: right-handed parallel beta-helix repeat-containing protein, partial [Candidatus Micrarchaeota archaeon]
MKASIACVILLVLIALSFPASVTGCGQIDNVTDTTYSLANNLAGANVSASPVPGNACIKIVSPNVIFDCNGFNITNNGSAADTYGVFLASGQTNVTLKNCPRISGYSYGAYVRYSNNSFFINNSFYNNSGVYYGAGFYQDTGFNNIIANNSAYGNFYGFRLDFGSNNTLTNNLAVGNDATNDGFFLDISSNNTLINNSASNSSGAVGFDIFDGSSDNQLINNSAYGNYDGYRFQTNANSNLLMDSTAFSNSNNGVFILDNADSNTLLGVAAYGNGFAGVEDLSGGSWNSFEEVQSYGNQYGFYLDGTEDALLTNVTAYANSEAGFFENTSDYEAATITDSLFHSNGWEIIQASSNDEFFTVTNTQLGNSSVNISLGDYVCCTEGFMLNDTVSPGPAPGNLSSFHDKYLKIDFGEFESVDSLTFHWSDAEAGSANESTLGVYTWNGTGWEPTPFQVLDIYSNSISVSYLDNITTDDIYGIFGELLPVFNSTESDVEIHVQSTSNSGEDLLSTGISDGENGTGDVQWYGPDYYDFSTAVAFDFDENGSVASYGAIPIEITPLSSPTFLLLEDDEVSDEIMLPFTVNFYGEAVDRMKVSSNGFIFLDNDTIEATDSGCCDGEDMSTQTATSGTDDMLAAGVWTDLYPPGTPDSLSYATEGSAPDRVFIVSYNNISSCCNEDGGFTFQIKLFENGSAAPQPPTQPPGDEDNQQPGLSVGFQPSCDGNVVTVDPPEGHVSVKDVQTADLIASGDTDGGEFEFQGC